jgi:hypothetical protein
MDPLHRDYTIPPKEKEEINLEDQKEAVLPSDKDNDSSFTQISFSSGDII